MIQNAVIAELHAELARAGEPGYRSRYDDDFIDAGPEGGNDDFTDTPPPPQSAIPSPHFDRNDSDQRRNASTPSSQPSPRDDSFGAGIF
jgi:stage V sporulation protein G